MQDVITIEKRLVPVEQIAFVEPFDPASNPEFKPEKAFKARVVLLNRDTVLTELASQEFSDAQGFRMLAEDNIAANPAVSFHVEALNGPKALNHEAVLDPPQMARSGRQRTEQAVAQ